MKLLATLFIILGFSASYSAPKKQDRLPLMKKIVLAGLKGVEFECSGNQGEPVTVETLKEIIGASQTGNVLSKAKPPAIRFERRIDMAKSIEIKAVTSSDRKQIDKLEFKFLKKAIRFQNFGTPETPNYASRETSSVTNQGQCIRQASQS